MIITGNAHFESVCHKKLVEWYQENYPEKNATEANVFTVWLCKTLQNYKCLVSTNFAGDGIYAEYTYNGDKQELYEDVYRKVQNRKHTEEEEEATTIPVLPKGQRVKFKSIDEAFEAGWKTCQEYIATCIEPADVISRDEAIKEAEKIFSPYSQAGNGDAISREVVLAKLRNLKEPEQGADPGYPPFGSCGDSVTIDELQKRYRDTQQTFSNLQSEVINPGDNCWARLPCGICRNTMMNCPLSVMQPAWTCSSSTATNQTGGDA